MGKRSTNWPAKKANAQPAWIEQEAGAVAALFSRGDLEQAFSRAEAITKKAAASAFGWKACGTVRQLQGRAAEALPFLEKAAALSPRDAEAMRNLAVCLAELGRLDAAENRFRAALALRPDYAEAHNGLGSLLCRTGRLELSEASHRRAIEIAPGLASAHSNLSLCLLGLEQYAAAEASARRALELSPNLLDASINLGTAQVALRKFEEAEASFRRVLAAKPDHAKARNSLGVCLHSLKRHAEAVESFQAALASAPSSPDTYLNLGIALRSLGRDAEAEASFARAIELKPDYAKAFNAIGNCYQDRHLMDEAAAAYRRAIELSPQLAESYNNLGVCLKMIGKLNEAEAVLRQAIELKADFSEAFCNLGSVHTERSRFAEAVACFRRALAIDPLTPVAYSNLLFLLNYHPDLSAEEIYADYAAYDRAVNLPKRAQWRAHKNAAAENRRLKVGYVSADFNRHSTRFFLEPLVANHDKSAFELFAYAELTVQDGWTARYKTYFEHWLPTNGLDDEALAERIRADGIDVLVDLGGHTRKSRLSVFALKPAPVSVSWLGYAYTTGISAIDYFLADAVCVPPGSEPLFAETPWRLDSPSFVYRPDETMGDVGELPALKKGHVTFGTLTRAARINAHTIAVWSRILNAVPGSRLVIDSASFVDPQICDEMAAKFAPYGVSRDRLDIGCHSPPWDLLRNVDICFDCFPHNSGVTLFECLYLGLPYVTLASRPSVGRIGSSILDGVGHTEWIAHTQDAYCEIAVGLASDLPKLAAIRSRLRAEMRSSPLMDEVGFTKRVEDAYRQMFGKWFAENRSLSVSTP